MTEFDYELNNAKDKVVGGVKEAVGNVTGNEKLEAEGILQSSKTAIIVIAGAALISLIVAKLFSR